MEPDISIIIPVYNVEKYLKKSIDSVLNQTIKNIEIILVDDGSIDKSGEIVDKYADQDYRIHVIHQKNQGVSSARNAGLRLAKGKYIGFVDSDDWIEDYMYEDMYKRAISSAAEIVICNYNVVNDHNNFQNKYNSYKVNNKLIDVYKMGSENYIMTYIRKFRHGNEIWNRIYKRNLIYKNNIVFDQISEIGIPEIAEDMIFNIKCALCVNKVAEIDISPYNYYMRSNSAMHSSKPRLIQRIVLMVEKLETYGKNTTVINCNFSILISRITNSVLREMIIYYCKENMKEQLYNDLKEIYKYNFVKKNMKLCIGAYSKLFKMEEKIFSIIFLSRQIWIYCFLRFIMSKIKK